MIACLVNAEKKMRKGIVLIGLVSVMAVFSMLRTAGDFHAACVRCAGWVLSMIVTQDAHAFPQLEPSEGVYGYEGNEPENLGYGEPVPRYDDSGEIHQMEPGENADEASGIPPETYDRYQEQGPAGYGEPEDAFEDPEQESEDMPDTYYQD
jgi:hypothetical protein